MRGRNWTPEEVEYLEENWGDKTVKAIAKKLNRTETAITEKKNRLHLGRHTDQDPRVPLNQILVIIYGERGRWNASKTEQLLKNNIPYHMHRVNERKFRVVDMREFWPWAEEHKWLFDFSNFEWRALGPEPEWVPKKREMDRRREKRIGPHNQPWTKSNDYFLQKMIADGMTMTQISRKLRRSEGAIKKRCQNLGCKHPRREESRPFSEEEVQKIIELHEYTDCWELIGDELNRSALACRARYERYLNPESSLRKNRGKGIKQIGIHEKPLKKEVMPNDRRKADG